MAGNRRKGERFAKLPIELLKHPAVATLPHAAFRVLAIFAAGYTGTNNGTLCCTDTWVRQFGLVSRDTLYASIRVLLDRNLIEVTRPGIKHRKVPTLYALAWQPVNSRNGELLGRFTPATHAYRDWSAPERRKKKVPGSRKPTEFQSDNRTSLCPIVGLQNADYSPISPTKVQGFQSDGREYSKNLGRIPGSVSGLFSPRSAQRGSERNGGAHKIEKLARLQQHLPDGDIAKITGESIDLVREVRAALALEQRP